MTLREKKIQLDPDTQDMIFQISSWHAEDNDYDDEDSSEKYLVKIFGVTEDGKSVSANLLNYTPFFYIKSPYPVTRSTIQNIHEFVVCRLPYKLKESLLDVSVVKKKDFWGFTNNEKVSFIRLKFKNIAAFKSAVRLFSKKVEIHSISRNPIKFKLYESNIEPFLRMMHIRDLDPSGWVKIDAGKYELNNSIIPTNCQIDITCDWTAISKTLKEKIAPLSIASFDLECSSSHGDFPVARKTYKKTAYELTQYYAELIKDKLDIKDTLFKEILLIFDHEKEGVLSKVFTKSSVKMNELEIKLKKSIDDIITILSGKLGYKNETKTSKDVILKALTKKLGDFDESENSDCGDLWVGIFPPLEGDSIIQIGTTVHLYGEKQCCYKNIITLGTCDPIDDVDVYCCTTEKELMLKWRELILKLDPDIITGYNIFGFDMSYLHDRAKELGITNDFMKIGRFVDHRSKYVEKELSSSALGDNLLKYIDMEGRVLIDIMKVVQRDHKLDSYKLDNVANHFMKMNKHDVHPSDIFRLQKGSSADRCVIASYCVQDCALCNHLMMKLEILANNIGMSNVCNVPLSYIFMRGQGIKIFSLVAKECRVFDFLIPTLNNYIKDDDEITEEDEDGYEGAIVLEPKEGIYIDDPISVLDYASLYPSSMISENLSHDSIVLDPKYDKLEGYEYLDISYDVYEKIDDKKVKKGEKIVRFAQFPNGEKGTIPKILMKLLKQRKETRKKIEFKTIVTKTGASYTGLVKESDTKIIVTCLNNKSTEIQRDDIESIDDTYDDFQKAVLDGLQLAYKVTANSLYGQCGAKTSAIYLKEIAACTTATGRKMIYKVKEFAEKHYNAEVVYGDSVTGDTPLLIKFPDETIDIVTIETLSNSEWIPYEGFKIYDNTLQNKEQTFIDAKVWTNGEWTQIKRVIRHLTNKKIYRVNTFKGCVDVTEDHSLIDINGDQIKPNDCIENKTEIMHSFPDTFSEKVMLTKQYSSNSYYKNDGRTEELVCRCCNKSKSPSEFYYNSRGKYWQTNRCRLCIAIKDAKKKNKPIPSIVDSHILNYNVKRRIITKEEAWVWGFFFGDGSCGDYNCNSGHKKSWAINNSNLEYLNKARDYLLKIEPKDVCYDFKINNTIDSSGVYKLIPNGSQAYMVEKYRALFYDKDKYKKIPRIILNANKEIREWFLEGYLTADGSKKEMFNGGLDFACKGKIGAQGLFYIAKSIGWDNLRVNIQEYKDNTYWIRYIKTEKYYDENQNKVKKIFDLKEIYGLRDSNEYVYDLETVCGKFHSGVGEIIVKNTDSCFLKLPLKDALGNPIKGKEAIMPSIQVAKELSAKFKPYLKPPHDAEYEKTFYPFILFSKKRYCANKYENDDEHFKMTSMGIVLKRRDNANIVKRIYGGILDIILNEQDIKKSLKFLKESLNDLVDGKYPLEELIITKSLRSDYKDPDRIAHKVLAERMGERDPGNKPQVNDRIPFVYVQVDEKKGKKILQGERIEHPDYIREKKLKPDYEFYITNQIMKPVLQLYALTLENLDGYRKASDYFDEIRKKLIKEKEGDMKKVKERLNDLKEDEVKKLLFDPILIKLANKRNKNTVITDYFKFE